MTILPRFILALTVTVCTLFTGASRSLPLCLVISLVSGCNAASSGIQLDEDLYERALAHARTLGQPTPDSIAERLVRGEAEALYEVAQSMNDSGDAISSVLIWHSLADDGSEGDDYEEYDEGEGYDYEGHVPSAMALGLSYYDVDKARALHYFLMATSKEGAPHQAAMYNAGRLYLELGDPSGALAYVRACATLDEGVHRPYARPQLSITCRKAYDTLMNELIAGSDMGLTEAVECFPYASMDDFPLPNSKEFKVFHGAMGQLEKFMEVVRANSGEVVGMGNSASTKAAKHLNGAIETLMKFRTSYTDQMSKLQLFLIGYILERITNLAAKLETGSDEL